MSTALRIQQSASRSNFNQEFRDGKRAKKVARSELAKVAEKLQRAEQHLRNKGVVPEDMTFSGDAVTMQRIYFGGQIGHLIAEIGEMRANRDTPSMIASGLDELVRIVSKGISQQDAQVFAAMITDVKNRVMTVSQSDPNEQELAS